MKTERLADGTYLHSGNPAEVLEFILRSAGVSIIDAESFRKAREMCDSPTGPGVAYVVIPVAAPTRKRRREMAELLVAAREAERLRVASPTDKPCQFPFSGMSRKVQTEECQSTAPADCNATKETPRW